MNLGRRAVLPALATGLVALFDSGPSGAQSAVVPAEIQAELFAKIALYDRNFLKRAGGKAHVILVVKPKHAAASVFAATMKLALGRVEKIGGLAHRETSVQYENARALAKFCRSERAAAVYLGPGLDGEIPELRAALAGIDVLSVGFVAEYVPEGVVLGFDLVSGKPKILVNLAQAKKQNVDFKADVLRLMKVYR